MPATRVWPSGEIATDRTSASVASIVAARLRDRTRHNLIVLSELPETSHWLSELKATELIQDLWPRSVARNRPVAAFHNFTVASTLPVASHFPSGLNATLKIGRASCRERV